MSDGNALQPWKPLDRWLVHAEIDALIVGTNSPLFIESRVDEYEEADRQASVVVQFRNAGAR